MGSRYYYLAHRRRNSKDRRIRQSISLLQKPSCHLCQRLRLHGDVGRLNVLLATGDFVAKGECPRHRKVHGWRIIDLGYGRKFVVDPAYAPKYDLDWIQMQRDIDGSESQAYDLYNN